MTAQLKNRSPSDLRRASEVLRDYELWMLQVLAAGLQSTMAGKSALNNALLESFAIHARLLIAFFYLPKTHQGDIVAGEFFEHPSLWESRRPTYTPELEGAYRACNKQVAHFTETRLHLTIEDKAWYTALVVRELGKCFSLFCQLGAHHKPGSLWRLDPLPDDDGEISHGCAGESTYRFRSARPEGPESR